MDSSGPELVFGLAGAIGTDLEFVGDEIQTSLAELGYECIHIRLSQLMHEINQRPWSQLAECA